MATVSTPRGVGLDRERLDFELGRRALSARQLAELAGINEATLSLARSGRPITAKNLQRLADALASVAIVPGAEAIVARPVGAG